MTKSRLLIVTDDADMGGTYKVAEQLVFGLREAFDVRFACLFTPGNEASRRAIASAGVKVHDYRVTESQVHRCAFATDEAEDLLEATNPELILLADGAEIWSHLALKSTAKARALPYVMIVNLVCPDCPERFVDLRERALAAIEAAHLVIFVSESIKRRFEGLFPGIQQTMLAIPNGCPSEFFAPRDETLKESMRKSLGIAEGTTMFLTTARIEPRKGQLLCLRALKEMKARRDISKVRLVLAGVLTKGRYKELFDAFVKEVERHGLGENIVILGQRDDVPDLLDACDAFILTPYAEGGLPLSIMEAMAKSLAVVTTSIDEIASRVDHTSAILVPSPNVSEQDCIDAMAEAMLHLHERPEARLELGRQAGLLARRLFHQEHMIAEYKRALLSIPIGQANQVNPPISGQDPRKALSSGDIIDFSKSEQMFKYTKDGWSYPENDGVWSDGTQSTFRFRLSGTRVVKLVVDLTPFVPSGHQQITDVFCNGKQIDSWEFDLHRREVRSIDISAGGGGRWRRWSQKRAGSVEIRLDHKSPVSARQFGIGEDARQLGIKLHSVEIKATSAIARFSSRLRAGLKAKPIG